MTTPTTRLHAHHTFTQSDFDRFAAPSGDDNPIHVDPAYAAPTPFGKTVAHGMMLYGFVCALLGRYDPGARQRSQTLVFPAPTCADETVTITTREVERRPEEGWVRLVTTIRRPDDELCLRGETILKWGDQ